MRVKRFLFRLFLAVVALVIIVTVGLWVFLEASVFQYQGNKELSGVSSEVRVHFDDYGIPHIEGSNKEDIYQALGYIHAGERMYQIEMMRRIGHGQLSEVLGAEFVKTDQLFRSLLPPDYLERQVKIMEMRENEEWYFWTKAYVKGINQWIDEKHSVPEFMILDIDPEPFTLLDIQAIAGYMAYSFGTAQRTDPLIDWVGKEWGSDYLKNMAVYHYNSEPYIPTFDLRLENQREVSASFAQISESLPIPAWHGSNSWVVSGKMTSSGKPILCNDTHIGYGMPQVWYESHLRTDDFEFYGNFLPGVPAALVGHNDFMGWGLTMLEQDDMDFYALKLNDDKTHYLSDSASIRLQTKEFQIGRKNLPDTMVTVLYSHHGPIVNDVFDSVSDSSPLALWWDYVKFDNHLLEAFYSLNNCDDVNTAEQAARMIHGPGLNLTYADTLNNIAWWACARIQNRIPENSGKFFLDGSTRLSEPQGYLPFTRNPKTINPPWEFVYSANDQPGPLDSIWIAGYYKPHQRASRIKELLISKSEWSIESMKDVITDVHAPVDKEVALTFHELLEPLVNERSEILDLLEWDGNHELEDVSPTVYYKLLYFTLREAMMDELGDQFETFLTTHWMERSYPLLIDNAQSIWWDNSTTDKIESREEIILKAFELTVANLENAYGPNSKDWTWDKAHTSEFQHGFSKQSPFLGKWLNTPLKGVRGGHETVCHSGFYLKEDGPYEARVGPQMRIILDLSQPRNSISISPAGQSGNFCSPHYSNQYDLYCTGKFRPQNQAVIPEESDNLLWFTPSY